MFHHQTGTAEPGDSHLGTPTLPASGGQERPRETEERGMQLTVLIDLIAPDQAAASTDIPCQTSDPEIWFAELPEDVEFAKTLCGTCPARRTCLAGALERQEPWGVWGGELFIQGVVVARKRPRGRPRKNPVAA